MIIECVNCPKKFEVNSQLIPNEGRSIECGSCGHVWFFKKDTQFSLSFSKEKNQKKNTKTKNINQSILQKRNKNKPKQKIINSNLNVIKTRENKEFDLIKYEEKPKFTLSKFLSYILVLLITFISFTIIIDTFKNQVYEIFPKLELIYFNFYETLKDMRLFLNDLI